MLEDAAVAVSTGAAGNIVAYMLQGRADALRAQVARIFKHGTEEERATTLQALGRDAQALSEHNVTRAELAKQWSNILIEHLTAHPEARGDIEALARPQSSGDTVKIGTQVHFGTGPQIGRDHIGDMTFGKGDRSG
jgi:hypothetical protein